MDRHTCKLCFRRFSNGRALGGHMRSHAASATVAATQKAKLPQDYSPSPSPSLSLTPSPSSCSSASRGELEAAERVAQVREQGGAALAADGEVVAGSEEAKQLAFYGLRENPKKSFRLVDPEFSSTFPAADYVAAAAAAAAAAMLQDWESETESSKPPSLRRRSKRHRRFSRLSPAKPEASFEPEPVSSVSDTTPEEDVARCLMMLSRDVWTTDRRDELVEEEGEEEEEEEDEDEEQPSDDSEEKRAAAARSRKGGRSRYQCGTCRKVFRSYQALGGHRASHKKTRACAATAAPPSEGPSLVVVDTEEEEGDRAQVGTQIQDPDSEVNAGSGAAAADRRIHECPVCFRVFGSGQALGGHKRSHLAYYSTATNPRTVQAPNVTVVAAPPDVSILSASAGASSSVYVSGTTKLAGESLIDLNLPAPMDEEVELCSFR